MARVGAETWGLSLSRRQSPECLTVAQRSWLKLEEQGTGGGEGDSTSNQTCCKEASALAPKPGSPVLPGQALREGWDEKELPPPPPLAVLPALTLTVNVTLEQASFH